MFFNKRLLSGSCGIHQHKQLSDSVVFNNFTPQGVGYLHFINFYRRFLLNYEMFMVFDKGSLLLTKEKFKFCIVVVQKCILITIFLHISLTGND